MSLIRTGTFLFLILFLKLYLFIYLERGARSREREGERERIPSRLHDISAEPDVRHDPTNCEIITLVKIKSQMLNTLSYPGDPSFSSFLICQLSIPSSYFKYHLHMRSFPNHRTITPMELILLL